MYIAQPTLNTGIFPFFLLKDAKPGVSGISGTEEPVHIAVTDWGSHLSNTEQVPVALILRKYMVVVVPCETSVLARIDRWSL